MLLLMFEIGAGRYAIDTRHIVEVLPVVEVMRPEPAAAGSAGVIDFRGAPLPVYDLSEIVTGAPAARRFSTRIVIIEDKDQPDSRVGLIAEGVSGTSRRDEAAFINAGATRPGDVFGPAGIDEDGLLQLLDVQQFLQRRSSSMPSVAHQS